MPISLYTLHSTAQPGEFIIQKFDPDYRCESVYPLTSTTCACPQGHKPNCRHRTMLPMFLKHGHIGDGWFLEWDTRMWRKPIHEMELTGLQEAKIEMGFHQPELCGLADDLVMGTSVTGAATPSPEAPPPSPPEGLQPSPSAEAPEPARPVGVGAPIVKRRRVP